MCIRDRSTKDLARPGPARVAASDENARQLETALRTNRHIKVREFSQMLSISMGTVPVSYTHLDVYKRQHTHTHTHTHTHMHKLLYKLIYIQYSAQHAFSKRLVEIFPYTRRQSAMCV